MKNIKFKIVLLLFFTHQQFIIMGQSVPNGGFESGSQTPTCTNIDGLYNWYRPMGHWYSAPPSAPQWMQSSCDQHYGGESCTNGIGYISRPASNRYIYISADNVRDSRSIYVGSEVIGVNLGANLLPYTQYTIRMKVAMEGCVPGGNNLRVYLAQYSDTWDTEGDNMEAINANIHQGRSPYTGTFTTWYQVERNFGTNGLTHMQNLILQCDAGAFYIDDVELVQRCASSRNISNVNYLGPANNLPYLNYGNFEEGANTLDAGPNVTLWPTSDVHYSAGGTITLSDGFTAFAGTTFNATIGACNLARMGKPEPEQVVKKPLPTALAVTYRNAISVQPNPFESQAEFSYSIEKESNVSIEVFNTFGQNVATIVKNEKHLPGSFNVLFEAKHLSSGIYFYVFQVNGAQETKRIVISK